MPTLSADPRVCFRAFGKGALPVLAALVLAAVAGQQTLWAQLPAVRLYATFPTGGKQGSTVDLTVTAGADLEGVSRLVFSHPGISAEQKTKKVEGKEEPQPIANQFTVTIAPEVPLGVYEMRAVGRFGISNPRTFVVGDRAEVLEKEPNNSLDQAQEIGLGAILNGRADGGTDVDFYKFTATAGQRIIVDCWAQRIDSRMDGTLTLFDSSGAQLDYSTDWGGRDPLLDFTAPADGQYVVRLHDFLYGGSNEYFYRLSIGATPYIDYVLPPSVEAGTKGQFVLYGRNLPGAAPAEGVSIDGKTLEQLAVEIEAPAEATAHERDSLTTPPDSVLDGFTYRHPTPEGSSNPVFISFATAPVTAEQEPNDEPDGAQQLAIPCEYVGQFQAQGDRDWITFSAKKGQVFWVEVFAQRIGSPADPYLLLQRITKNDKGQVKAADLQGLDDSATNIGGLYYNTATDDPVYRFAVPEDGDYRLLVHDLYYHSQGAPHYVYRLSIREEKPDFRLVALAPFPVAANQSPSAWTTVLRKGGTAKLNVMLFRRDNFGGAVQLSAEGLPEGVTCPGATIASNQTNTTLILTAAEDAADWAGTIRVVGKAKIADTEVVREARGGAVIWPGPAAGAAAQARMTRDIALAVAGETAPFLAQAGIDQIRLAQSHQLNVPVKLTRRGDFKGDVALTAVGLPPNTQNENVTLKAEDSEGVVHLFVQNNAPAGTYTFHLQATTKVPYTKKPDGSDKKDVNVIAASTPVTVTIAPGPMTLAANVPNGGAVKKGAKIEVPVTVNRRNNFAGPVTLELALPAGVTGVKAEQVTVPADQNQGTLVIEAAADATEGNHAHVAIRAKGDADGQAVEVDQTIPLNVQK